MNLPKNIYPSFDKVTERRACYAVELAFRSYFDDIRRTVQLGVMSELRPLLNSDDLQEQQFAHDRQDALNTWLQQPHPLSFKESVLPYLIRAVCPQNHAIPQLNRSHTGDQNRSWFANVILDVCTHPLARRKPPFIKDGNFRAVMAVAIDEITMAANRSGLNLDQAHDTIRRAIEYVSTHLQMSHIPWAANPVEGQPSSTAIVHHTWVNFVSMNRSTHTLPNGLLTRQESSHLLAHQTAADMNHKDAYGEWSITTVPITKFASILHKHVPPKELTIEHTTFDMGTNITKSGYLQMLAFYDGSRPLHQLALFCGYIMSCLAPNVFRPKDFPMPIPNQPAPLANYIRRLQWTRREGQKGTIQPIQYITATTVFFISILDPSSPIKTRLRDDKQFSSQWFSKHSEYHRLLQYYSSSRLLFFSGAKGITTLCVCRFNLAQARSSRIMNSARWYEDLNFLDNTEIHNLHKTVTDLLRNDKEHGVFDAVAFLAGGHTANILANSGAILSRQQPNVFKTSSQLSLTNVASSSKRTLDDDDDLVIIEPVMTASEVTDHTTSKRRRV